MIHPNDSNHPAHQPYQHIPNAPSYVSSSSESLPNQEVPGPQNAYLYIPQVYSGPIFISGIPVNQPAPAAQNNIPQPRRRPNPLAQPIVGRNDRDIRLRMNSRQLIGFSILIFIHIVIDTVLIIVVFCVDWYQYCYWNFSLNKISSKWNTKYDSGSISGLYDDICDPDMSYYRECPHLCTTLKDIRNSGNIIYGFGSVSMLLHIVIYACIVIKIKRPTWKLPNFVFHLLLLVNLVFYTIGFIIYYTTSNFNEHFYRVDSSSIYKSDNPVDFDWLAGMAISIVIQIFKLTQYYVSVRTLSGLSFSS